MDQEALDRDVAESTSYLIDIIKKEYEKSPSGTIKGYLVRNSEHAIVRKRDVQNICHAKDDPLPLSHRGSIICSAAEDRVWTLVAMLIAYIVGNNLRKEFKDYNFKEFSISSELFWGYKYIKGKHRKKDCEIPFLKVKIKW